MSTQHIIRFMSDGNQLTGTLHLPDTPKPSVIIGCHGLLANRQSPKQIYLAEALNGIGVAYFRFDHRGCGDSAGSWDSHALLPSRCRDLYHAIQTMQSLSEVGPLAGFFGSSFGGTVVMAAAAEHEVPLVISYGAPVNSRSVHQLAAEEIMAHNQLSIENVGTLEFDICGILPLLNNLLIMHGEKDEIVPLEHAQTIYRLAGDPKKLLIYRGGDHRLSDSGHQQQFIAECLSWCRHILS